MATKKPVKSVYRGKESAAEERAEMRQPMGYKNGGKVKCMANGGAPNTPSGTQGPGVRSNQSKSFKK